MFRSLAKKKNTKEFLLCIYVNLFYKISILIKLRKKISFNKTLYDQKTKNKANQTWFYWKLNFCVSLKYFIVNFYLVSCNFLYSYETPFKMGFNLKIFLSFFVFSFFFFFFNLNFPKGNNIVTINIFLYKLN